MIPVSSLAAGFAERGGGGPGTAAIGLAGVDERAGDWAEGASAGCTWLAEKAGPGWAASGIAGAPRGGGPPFKNESPCDHGL